MTSSSGRTWFVVNDKGLLVRREGDKVALLTDVDARELGLDESGSFAIARSNGVTAVATSLDSVPEGSTFEIASLRALAAWLDEETFLAAGRAIHVMGWATTSQFCGRCGTKTVLSTRERCMTCPACKLTAYPRISPAIIVLVRREHEALLARNAKFPGAVYSTLAGFSEIGESLEDTLSREVKEEVGIDVSNIRYFGSQPWPFPHSLMIGFHADYAGGDIVVDGEEIADAKWFSADALPAIPPRLSIARRMIDAWLHEVGADPRRSGRKT